MEIHGNNKMIMIVMHTETELMNLYGFVVEKPTQEYVNIK